MGGLVFGLLVFGRSEYLAAYDEPSGQVFLAAALGGLRGADHPRPTARRVPASEPVSHDGEALVGAERWWCRR